MAIVNKKMAQDEVSKWLDIRRTKEGKREDMADSIEDLEGYFEEGILTLSEDGKLTQKLEDPLKNAEGTVTLKELVFVPRIRLKDVNSNMSGVKSTDGDGRLLGYASALTGVNRRIIENIDYDDWKISQTIITFFL